MHRKYTDNINSLQGALVTNCNTSMTAGNLVQPRLYRIGLLQRKNKCYGTTADPQP